MRQTFKFVLITVVLAAVVTFGLWRLSKAETYQLFGDLTYKVDTTQPMVAITFDDGPSQKYATDVLDILFDHDAVATFFINGEHAAKMPEVMAAMVTLGHDLGNHAYTHERMVLISPTKVRDQLARTDAIIRQAGHPGPIHFRPPYGNKLFVLPWVLSKQNRLTVMWDVAPEYPGPVMANEIVARTLDQARPGSIILLHPMWRSGDQTRAAIGPIIEGLRAKGLEPVTLSTLLAAEGQ